MRKIFLLFFMSLCCGMMYGQKYTSDYDFNHSTSAAYINDTFVKSFIGFRIKQDSGFEYVSKVDLTEPLVINGVTYKGKIVVKCSKQIEFVTLDDIRKQYFPNASGDIVYMINKFFVTNDVESYKLDKNFIDRCEILQSSDFDVFKDKMKFSIIRVFTKDDANPIILR